MTKNIFDVINGLDNAARIPALRAMTHSAMAKCIGAKMNKSQIALKAYRLLGEIYKRAWTMMIDVPALTFAEAVDEALDNIDLADFDCKAEENNLHVPATPFENRSYLRNAVLGYAKPRPLGDLRDALRAYKNGLISDEELVLMLQCTPHMLEAIRQMTKLPVPALQRIDSWSVWDEQVMQRWANSRDPE